MKVKNAGTEYSTGAPMWWNGTEWIDGVKPEPNNRGLFNDDGTIQMHVITSAPSSPTRGMLAYADGTSWDPGSGEGVYRYNGAAWVFIG